jgi:hypothetical protein
VSRPEVIRRVTALDPSGVAVTRTSRVALDVLRDMKAGVWPAAAPASRPGSGHPPRAQGLRTSIAPVICTWRKTSQV